MRTWHYFDRSTGLFVGKSVSYPADHPQSEKLATSCAPDGCAPIEGVTDYLSQRVDLTTGQVVSWQPPQPSPDHEWNAGTKRWQLTAASAAKASARLSALSEIAALELSQLRALRELALGDSSAVERLKSVDAQVAALRKDL